MVAVPVNPKVLAWARSERGLLEEEAARRLKTDVADLLALERGDRIPTLGELERIASQYSIPLLSLLLPEPLPPVKTQRPKLQDFRAFEGQPAEDLSHETLLAIEDAYAYIEALADLKQTDPALISRPTLPVFNLSNKAASAAASERARHKISVEAQIGWKTDREAFLIWREVVEAQGVFACQLKLGADDARGFAISDDNEIPLLVIDSSEVGYPAKIFTLWHEYAHLLLRQSGISNQNHRNVVERFCNSFAANYLMPEEHFIREAKFVRQTASPWSDLHLKRLAEIFKVSKSAVAIQLESTGLANDGFYREMLAQWRKRQQAPSGGRATHIEKQVNRLGGRYLETIGAALNQGTISKIDAYEFTSIKPKYFDDVIREVGNRRAAYGRPWK
jgi:Zn-dependent peptidase ImmA (M78 family)